MGEEYLYRWLCAVVDAGFVKEGFQIYSAQSVPQNFADNHAHFCQKGRHKEIPKYVSIAARVRR